MLPGRPTGPVGSTTSAACWVSPHSTMPQVTPSTAGCGRPAGAGAIGSGMLTGAGGTGAAGTGAGAAASPWLIEATAPRSCCSSTATTWDGMQRACANASTAVSSPTNSTVLVGSRSESPGCRHEVQSYASGACAPASRLSASSSPISARTSSLTSSMRGTKTPRFALTF